MPAMPYLGHGLRQTVNSTALLRIYFFNVIITKLFTKIEPQNYLSKSRPVPCSVAVCDDEFSAAMRE